MPAKKSPIDFAKLKKAPSKPPITNPFAPSDTLHVPWDAVPALLNRTIDVLVSRADMLHDAGVTHLSIAGVTLSLVRPPAHVATVDAPPPAPQHIDPLRDPATFPGGRIPGFKRESEVYEE